MTHLAPSVGTVAAVAVRPIAESEWLPDRCLALPVGVTPSAVPVAAGCASLVRAFSAPTRGALVAFYRDIIARFGGCGYVAWLGPRVVAFHNFFPREIARVHRFHGWGSEVDAADDTLVHHCLSVARDPHLRHHHLDERLVTASLAWAKAQGWHFFEVHEVPPGAPVAFACDQKACAAFWLRLGFTIFRTDYASHEARHAADVAVRHSLLLDLTCWQPAVSEDAAVDD